MSEAWEPYDEYQDQSGYGDTEHLEKHEWVGSFVADPDTGQIVIDHDAVHAAIIEEEFTHYDEENGEWIDPDWDSLVTGWLYQDHNGGDLWAYFVSLGGETNPWATSEETKQKVMTLISQKYGGRPIHEGTGTISQWNERGYEAEAKVAWYDSNPDARPSYWMRFLHDHRDDNIHIWPLNPHDFDDNTHAEKLDELGFYDAYDDDGEHSHENDANNSYETGYIFNDGVNTAYNPATKSRLNKWYQENNKTHPFQTVQDWNDNPEAQEAYHYAFMDSEWRWLWDPIHGLNVWPTVNDSDKFHSAMLERLFGPEYYDFGLYTGGYIYPDGRVKQTYTANNSDYTKRPDIDLRGLRAAEEWVKQNGQISIDPDLTPKVQDDILEQKPYKKYMKKLKPHRHRVHIRKHHIHEMLGYNPKTRTFITPYFNVAYPPGGQVDTTDTVMAAKIAIDAGTLIKFVSLDDGTFLVGENTHHAYLLEAEYQRNTFPPQTNAIGRAWVENKEITGVGFDFGSASSQAQAIKRLRAWGHEQGYNVAPELEEAIRGLA